MNKHKRVVLICLYLVSMASIVCHAHDEDIASLIQQLGHTDEDVQNSASKALEEIGEAAVPALIVGLNHENPVVREAVMSRLCFLMSKIPPNHKDIKNIVRAVVKALKDDEYKVRFEAMECFLGMGESVTELPPKLATEVISGLVQSLYYGSPFFDGITAGLVLNGIGDRGRAALTEALHSSSWSLRFGAAVAYGYVFLRIHNSRGMLLHHYIKPLPKAVVPILAEGLTHPDWKTQDDAARVLIMLDLRHCHICEHTDEARKALEALPPFGIVSQTIKDGHWVMDSDSLDSFNTDGITFKFNRSIGGSWKITISPFTETHDVAERTTKRVYCEPLGWNVEKSSHSVTITPPEGKELARGQNYTIQLRDFKDVLGNQVDAEIEFRIKGDRDIILGH